MSPAKLALRRHLSQEKLAAQNGQVHSGNLVQTRTIGDLVSGEIERTLEISNQVMVVNSNAVNLLKKNRFYSKKDITIM